MLRLRFLREANTRETSWIINRCLKKEKVVRERETDRQTETERERERVIAQKAPF